MSALTIVAIIAIIILTVGLNGLYHKIFDVYYLGAGGFFKEMPYGSSKPSVYILQKVDEDWRFLSGRAGSKHGYDHS